MNLEHHIEEKDRLRILKEKERQLKDKNQKIEEQGAVIKQLSHENARLKGKLKERDKKKGRNRLSFKKQSPVC